MPSPVPGTFADYLHQDSWADNSWKARPNPLILRYFPCASKCTTEQWTELHNTKESISDLLIKWGLLEVQKSKTDECDDYEKWYFITLTQPDVDKRWDRFDKVIPKILRSKQIAPLEYMYAKELTQKDTPHVHFRLKTNKYIDKRVITKFNDKYIVDVQIERGGCYNYLTDDKKKHPDMDWFFCSDNYGGPRVEKKSNDLV